LFEFMDGMIPFQDYMVERPYMLASEYFQREYELNDSSFKLGKDNRDKSIFYYRFGFFLQGSKPFSQILDFFMENQNYLSEEKISQVIKDVKEGIPFSKSLSIYPSYFSERETKFIQFGEEFGKLDEIMTQLGNFTQNNLI
ncbi:type II secretion system F family protein, partial [Nanoarchaeota archaeon]